MAGRRSAGGYAGVAREGKQFGTAARELPTPQRTFTWETGYSRYGPADVERLALMRWAIAARCGEGRPPTQVQCLPDNESMYTALETVIAAERLSRAPVTTPADSRLSEGLSEALVHTLPRDYLDGAEFGSAEAVLDQLPRWLTNYNGVAPHAGLGDRVPLTECSKSTAPGAGAGHRNALLRRVNEASRA